MTAFESRLAAAHLLFAVTERRRTLDEAMATSDVFAELDGADRGFARAMTSAALRRLGQIDAGLAPLMSRPLNTVSPPVRALIRIGAAQLWLMATPPHAAVNQTVEAARQWREARAGGAFVNAVLRRASEDRPDVLNGPARTIWPDWLTQEFVLSLGEDGAERLAHAQLKEPTLHLSARDDADRVAAQVSGRRRGIASVELETGAVESLPGFEDGAWWVQDAAAAVPATLLGFARGDRVLDVCAAPGGKTLQLAAMGAAVTALDRSGPRLARLKDNLARTQLSAEIIEADALKWTPPQPFDFILLDAPCSAHGTLRRHPEGAWIKTAEETRRFAEIQGKLLQRALTWLAPGGTLIYCVCSPLKHEGRDIIAASGSKRRAIGAGEVSVFADGLTPEGDLITVPGDGWAYDAFFMARLIGE